MIKMTARALAGAALALLPLTAASSVQAAEHDVPARYASLHDGIEALPLAAESRTGYQRTSFKHWVDADRGGCSTRAEVLIAESRARPEVGPKCKVISGRWFSYYDGVTVTDPKGLDIDHMVPLAEAWDSGASQFSAARREAYANDLEAERSLVASVAAGRVRHRGEVSRTPLLDDPHPFVAHAADWPAFRLVWLILLRLPYLH
ncbi:HNH endonuclease [Streptomyces rimosus]|uniref:HNH endonuclease n=2 Tax=Streptomyces rimosus TaxID=1927 RepID=A0A8A1V6G3_STRR1|nr:MULTISPECIES: HNH endonuclease [Streptomyces]MYT42065.1 HNH endonuclease [Streptomyces sp. SID5471]KUJ35220.1 hypothetical protein ADK46_16990 [Streptomyces rimosus subsp. rimosus]QDA10416.1 HNH endonuclease [Streptomyces rimosus]QGY71932.1 HNH endonuclease [Streptomyces rimosus R6-500]QST86782.1 HNH endonuclease [Streptomyces rimosus subsp. rimosus ATCC 10970]